MKNNDQVIEELKFEKAEIIARATDLDRFMDEHGSEVSKHQHHAMRDQQTAMWGYVHALAERIQLLKEDGKGGKDSESEH